ncbi:MAG: asparaginase [Pseudomonadota bacterium]
MTGRRPRIAVIGTGGTISSFGADPFDVQDYMRHGDRGDAARMLAHYGDVARLADLVPVAFPSVPSTEIGFAEWRALVLEIDRLAADEMDGVVILHGTATMEETAYALSLTLQADIPVVLTGAQRPASALSADGGANLSAAIRTAAAPAARDLGVLLVMNEEIHAAREVTKTATFRLQTFRSPDFGALGHADVDSVAIYRRPARATGPGLPFDIRGVETPPRVDIAYAHAGADGTAIRAFAAAGAQGIVAAALAPGLLPPAQMAALVEASADGIACAMSSRAGSGRVVALTPLREAGILAADTLNPQKARILLQCALAAGMDRAAMADAFATY